MAYRSCSVVACLCMVLVYSGFVCAEPVECENHPLQVADAGMSAVHAAAESGSSDQNQPGAPGQARYLGECSPDSEWESQLRGRTLVYAHIINGTSVERRLSLCSNHSFRYQDNNNYSRSDAYTDFRASTRVGKTGRWQVDGNRLLLLWSDGIRSSHVLSRRYIEKQNESGTFMDDERWLNVTNRVCY